MSKPRESSNAIDGDRRRERRTKSAELLERGKRARRRIPRSAHAELVPVSRDPVAFIEAQNRSRLRDLVPLRNARMLADSFSFFRGTAGLMAHDLERQPATGMNLVICGDAHINNFGLYASPERTLVFDLNDFDEAAIGPWEWDVKRLVTSVVVGGRELGFSNTEIRDVAVETVATYRQGLRRMISLSALDRFYFRVDRSHIESNADEHVLVLFERAAKKAVRRTSERVIAKSMKQDESGGLRFVDAPPVLTHVSAATADELVDYFEHYRATVRPDVALLLSMHSLSDVARRAVGVGSVGTRCYVLALTGPESGCLVLQVKEALPSVVSTHGPTERTPGAIFPLAPSGDQGRRVVTHQRILQAVSDPFLGHFHAQGRDFYVRQFRDMKGSVELEDSSLEQFTSYATGCAYVLARAHGQSPGAAWVAGYMGKSDVFDRAVAAWCVAYADRMRSDYEVVRAGLMS